MSAPTMNPDELAELEEQRAFLVRSLDDLDRELGAGDIDELDAGTLRDDYTRRLAEVQRAIEGGRASIAAAAPRRNRARLAGAVVLVAVVAIGSGIAVAQVAGRREPGQTSTGGIRESSNDLLNRAAGLQQQGEVLEAIKLYDRVIEDDPENDEALAERGFVLLRLSMGADQVDLVEDGLRYVERALAINPDEPRWLFYRAVGLRLADRDEEATAAFDAALANDPPADLREQIEAIREDIGA